MSGLASHSGVISLGGVGTQTSIPNIAIPEFRSHQYSKYIDAIDKLYYYAVDLTKPADISPSKEIAQLHQSSFAVSAL